MKVIRYLSDYYFAHITIATVAFLLAVMDVPAGQNFTVPLLISEFLNVFSLFIVSICIFELVKKRVKQAWLVHILVVIFANFFTVLLDFNFDLFIFGQGRMTNESFNIDNVTASHFLNEYSADLKYAATYWLLSVIIQSCAMEKQKEKNKNTDISQESKHHEEIKYHGFLKDIPIHDYERIDVLEAQENYVKVYAGDGEHLVLYKFKNAIAEMGESLGLQVHRSYWVKKSAIGEFKKKQGRGEIVTTTGKLIPVSRTYLKDTQACFEGRLKT